MKPTTDYTSSTENDGSKSYQITFCLLGFDRRGLTNDVLNAVRLDGRAWFQGVRLDSDGVRSEGHIRLRIDRPETIDVLTQRLKAIAGLIRVTPRISLV